jgi:hypothetical protein
MRIALLHQSFDPQHVENVKAEMRKLGAPEVKAVYMPCYDMYVALEGCHRIRAAKELGLTPIISSVEYSDTVTTSDLGLEFGGDSWTIAEIAHSAANAEIIEF